MLHQLYNLGSKERSRSVFVVACSGGVDSMAVVDFYHRGNKNFKVAYFNHGTKQSKLMEEFVRDWCGTNNREFLTGKISTEKPAELSHEEFWRNERYYWLLGLGRNIVTCHHINDVAEGYLFSLMHGQPKLMKARIVQAFKDRAEVIYRPFLTNTKDQFVDWCLRHQVEWLEDKSNEDVHFPRNRIRHNIMPEVLQVNPGFLKVLRKKYLSGPEASVLVPNEGHEFNIKNEIQ